MPMNVLVIDDDDIARELLTSTLENSGCTVHELPSPIGATKKMIDESIEAVVLDVMMPEVSGDKLAKMLRGNPKLEKIGIVLVSGIAAHELEKLRVESGANAVVQKADIRTNLVRAVKDAVREAR